MVSVSNLSKSFGAQMLFEGASFQLNPGERYGLVGANGSGKSTLLSILAGDMDASEGAVSMSKHLRVGVLRQDQFLHDDQPIISVPIMGNRELWEAMVEKAEILRHAESSFDSDRFSELEEIVQRHDGYAAEAQAGEILEGLGIPAESHDQPLGTLSGGFKLRVLLAQALTGSPDVLFLDEPTNHLDILSIRWLEKFLRRFPGPVVVISHDHRFLDNVATHILDVDYRTVTLYKGDYTAFVRAKVEERERREKEISNRQQEIAHHQKFVDRFRAKASKARQAQSKLRLIEKRAESLEALPQTSRRYPSFAFRPRRPSGREVLKVEGIDKSYGDNNVLNSVDLSVARGDRLAIVGPNGIGKSTLLKIAVGAVEPDRGEVEWGYETHVGYFAQDHADLFEDEDVTAESWIASFCPGKTTGFVRGEMGRVLFSGDEAKKSLGALSGGEAARLVFCRISLERPNVLVLDEPTNHLDLEATEALVEALESFDGTLLLVSHDRWFVSQLATRIVEVRSDEIVDYRGTYDEYVHACGDDHLDVDRVVLKAKRKKSDQRQAKGKGAAGRGKGSTKKGSTDRNTAPPVDRKGLLRKQEEATAEIEGCEVRIGEIEECFASPGFFEEAEPESVRSLEEELKKTRLRLEALMAEWEAVTLALEEVEETEGSS